MDGATLRLVIKCPECNRVVTRQWDEIRTVIDPWSKFVQVSWTCPNCKQDQMLLMGATAVLGKDEDGAPAGESDPTGAPKKGPRKSNTAKRA